MKISVRVKPGAKEAKIEEKDGRLFIWVNALAEKGKANKRLTEQIADYYHIPKSYILIKSGLKSRNKIVEIKGK
jgi:uncharacterized protein